MSAFIVSEKTMHNVCVALNVNDSPCEQLDDLGNRLFRLNNEAIFQRYGKREELRLYRFKPVNPKKIQQLKSLQCLIYQCTEGKIPETALYHELVERANELAHSIVHDLPEYDQAAWD